MQPKQGQTQAEHRQVNLFFIKMRLILIFLNKNSQLMTYRFKVFENLNSSLLRYVCFMN